MKRKSSDLSATVHGIGDPAFATDDLQRIVSWNAAAEQLLGYRAAEIIGQTCPEIMCGSDLFGNRLCDHDCTLIRMTRRHEPIASFEMCVRKADGQKITVAVSVLALPAPEPPHQLQIHILHPIHRDGDATELLGRLIGWAATVSPSKQGAKAESPAPPQPALTNRELEVLRLLAAGKRTEEVADELSVSVATVRTHIRNLLEKLAAHSRLEAVSIALRKKLI